MKLNYITLVNLPGKPSNKRGDIRRHYSSKRLIDSDFKIQSLLVRGKILKTRLVNYIVLNVWPFSDAALLVDSKKFMFDLQYCIAWLSKHNLSDEAFDLMDFYSFHLVNRAYSIYLIANNKSKLTPGFDGFVLKDKKDCMLLLMQTNYFKVNKINSSVIRRIYIEKSNGSKRSIGINNILDRVLQTMMVNLLDPFYDVKFHEDSYGFRKGRSQIHAAAQLHKYILSGMGRKTLLFLDIKSFFDEISHDFLKNIRVPKKFSRLVSVWINCKVFCSESRKYINPTQKGISQGAVFSPLFSNIVLLGFHEAAYKGLPKAFLRVSSTKGYNITAKTIIYADDIVLIFNLNHYETIFSNVVNFLSERGLSLSKQKTKKFRMNTRSAFKFDYLGFVFYYISNKKLKYSNLLSRRKDVSRRKKSKEPGSFLITICKSNLTKHKLLIKRTIRLNYNLSVPQLIVKLNPIIIGFTNYFS